MGCEIQLLLVNMVFAATMRSAAVRGSMTRCCGMGAAVAMVSVYRVRD